MCLEEKTPIHVADLEEMSATFAKRLEATISHTAAGGRPTAGKRNGGDRKKQRKEKRSAHIPGDGVSTSKHANDQTKDMSASSSKKPATARERMNLGEIHLKQPGQNG